MNWQEKKGGAGGMKRNLRIEARKKKEKEKEKIRGARIFFFSKKLGRVFSIPARVYPLLEGNKPST